MKRVPWWLVPVVAFLTALPIGAEVASGALLPDQPAHARLWWALSSAAKIRPDQTAPSRTNQAIQIRCARNETDAAQLIVRPDRTLAGFAIESTPLLGPDSAVIDAGQIEIFEVGNVQIELPTDRAGSPGPWPDPLFPMTAPRDLAEHVTRAFWIRLHAPREARAGLYRGQLRLTASDWAATAPIELTIHDFSLPDRMTCTTAFGFSPNNVFRYHRLETEADKRAVLEKYWASFAAHHISPYNPAPLDPIRVQWPDVRPPEIEPSPWLGLRVVTNESHGGEGALLIHDDRVAENVTVTYEPLIPIPAQGFRVAAWYRTPIPGHRFMVSINHFDADRKWMPGRNNDITLRGSGAWQKIDELITGFPPGSRFVQFHARATTWSDAGEGLGMVWFDDISIVDADTGAEWIRGGDFEPQRRTEPVLPPDQLVATFDFTAWDRAMDRAMNQHHFNSFRVDIPGIGGGTFHELYEPELLGLAEDTPEYPFLFDSYCRQLEAHLKARGWLEAAFVYWFDEPSPDQYPFVQNGFNKLKRSSPGIARMLTEQVEPGLIGGPDIWCSITDAYNHERAEARRKHGEKFWWYVCTGPKAPYATLFIDRPAPELRIWLWQTFQRNIEGILVWESTYWTSDAAYPDPQRPQNPYSDAMSWTSGYSTPVGDKRPWGNGDGRFIYPPLAAANADGTEPILDGPIDSIRWEHLRDGIEDYEYLCILRRLVEAHAGRIPASLESEARHLLVVPDTITASLTEFTIDGEPIEQHRDQVAHMIERLSRGG